MLFTFNFAVSKLKVNQLDIMMKKALQWLYDNWMKATPFLAIYSAILIWM